MIPTFPDQVADLASGAEDIQTFYLTDGGPNLVFHADHVQRVYLQTRTVLVTPDGTIASTTAMGPGTIYTVVSTTPTPRRPARGRIGPRCRRPARLGDSTRSELVATCSFPTPIPPGRRPWPPRSPPGSATQSPATDPHTYDKVEAIGRWMATHVHYTTDIPPLPPGSDAVDSFLFGKRGGYCEQISTATVVMLRSLGIPAREAVGYVPGPYNPITDLYDIQAKDAHAWVQVWFPGYGWQNFDPTANVPLANPTPGSVLATSLGHALGRVPWIPVTVVVAAAAAVVWVFRRRSRRPATWAHQVAADLATGGARLGLGRRPDETLTAYGRRLSAAAPGPAPGWPRHRTGGTATYGGIEPTADQIAAALIVSRRFRGVPKRRRRGRGSGGPPGSAGTHMAAGQAREWASASSNEAPAANSGR